MKKTILIIVLAALCLFFKAFAQEKNQNHGQVLHGKVTDKQGLSLPGATVKIAHQNTTAISDSEGRFTIIPASTNGTIVVSFIGYQTANLTIPTNLSELLIVQLNADANSLNEVQVIGYGTTTKRLNTGSVSAINAADIEKQPVTNLQSALSGRMPGVFVQTTNGLPGGGVNIQIRGKGSILAGTDPLYIIDGVPYSTTLMDANSAIGSSAINGLVSPLNSINPQDIESITVLKDADATAIYGSRGANGVVLITTKKGKAGKTKLDVNFSQGYNKNSAMPPILSLDQYLRIRKEAYSNDGLTPSSDPTSSSYAPDLTVYSQTQGTNFAKYMLGGTGHVTDMQAGLSGGDSQTTFSIGGNFHSETTVLPGDNLYQRGGLRYNIQHKSLNNKFSIALSGVYTVDGNNLVNPVFSYKSDIFLPPNFPLTTPDGNINWQYGLNPLADINARLKVKTDNLLANMVLKYSILSNLDFNTSIGYNKINIDQRQTFPLSSQNPQ
jgi:TonB-linked SusC/RagA family outer membrane protein